MDAPTCRDEADPGALGVEQAQARILQSLTPLAVHERVALRQAYGRVLGEPVHARLDVPRERNSAMDGYALRHADLDGGRATLTVAGTSRAGDPYRGPLPAGASVRIMTGAVVPDGADTVVMQEEVTRDGESLRVNRMPSRGEFVRRPGDDVEAGALLLDAGKRLGPAEVGLLASQGMTEVAVVRRVQVAFFSTGDELVGAGTALGPGQIHDSNRYTLYGLLLEQGVQPLDLGVVGDTPEALEAAFEQARSADVVVSTGGVSVGDADFVKSVAQRHGALQFWKIAVRPGRPLTFGRVGDAHFFGLPGNPVSVAVTFALFVAPALDKLSGTSPPRPLRLRVPTLSTLSKAPGRRDYQRGVLEERDGQLAVRTTGAQGSHVLSSMSEANCYVVLGESSTGAEIGTTVEVIPFANTL